MIWLIFGIILAIGLVVGLLIFINYKNNERQDIYETKIREEYRLRKEYRRDGSDVSREEFEKEYQQKHGKFKKISKGYAFLGLFALIICLFGCVTSVQTGYTGVVTIFGSVQPETLEAGLHFKTPFESVTQIDNRVQKQSLELSCFSSDIQEVKVKFTINYQISKQNASEIYKTIGVGYYETVMQPRIEEVVKNAVKEYTAETLVNGRDILANTIYTNIKEDLSVYNIEVVSSSVEDMDFTDAFTQAVENKQVASQEYQKAQIEQERVTMEQRAESERAIIVATAEAEIAEIQARADKTVAEINADSAEYQGRKDGAIILQYLISINGYHLDDDGQTILNAEGIAVTPEELKIATQNLLLYYYINGWSGDLPTTYIGTNDFYELFKTILGD